MATWMPQRWQPTFDSGLSRRDREGCTYDTYIPDPLMGRPVTLNGDVAADVADADWAIATFVSQTNLKTTDAFARLLLRADAVASSRIEGLEVGARRLLRAQAAIAVNDDPQDLTAEEVLGNIEAMNWAVEVVAEAERLTPGHLLEIHQRLLGRGRMREHAGRWRTEQNWIGGSRFNPCRAIYVPPPPEYVRALMEDLCEFCNSDHLPAVVQAAMAHAQFETIHPFADGNGRTGRALIHIVLKRRRPMQRTVPPVSLILATWSDDYVNCLMESRYAGSSDTPEVRDALNRWVGLFAMACGRAAADARLYASIVRELQWEWRKKTAHPRKGSTVDMLIDSLPGAPILTVASAAGLTGRSFQATNEAIRRLEEGGVLRQVRIGKRNRAFEAPDMIDVFTDIERRLASPDGDTRFSPPARPSPQRRL
jgi:Fic family protein